MPKDVLGAGLVSAVVETKASALLRLIDTPSRQYLCQFGDIFLGVTAVHAESVQLRDFAGVVFIESAGTVLVRLWPRRHLVDHAEGSTAELPPLIAENGELRMRTHALPVVQIEEHGRALGSGDQKIFEFAENVRPDHIPLVRG